MTGVQHSPGSSGSKVLPRCNNDERQWFAKASGRIQVVLMQVKGLTGNEEARPAEIQELAAEINNLKRDYTKQWDAVRARMEQDGRREALQQATTRWTDMEKQLSDAVKSLGVATGAVNKEPISARTRGAAASATKSTPPPKQQPNHSDWQLQWQTMARQWEERHKRTEKEMREREAERERINREEIQSILKDQEERRREAVEVEKKARQEVYDRWKTEVEEKNLQLEELHRQIKILQLHQRDKDEQDGLPPRRRLYADWELEVDADHGGRGGDDPGERREGATGRRELDPGERRDDGWDARERDPGEQLRGHQQSGVEFFRMAREREKHKPKEHITLMGGSLPRTGQRYNPYQGSILDRFADDLKDNHRSSGTYYGTNQQDEDDEYYRTQFPHPFNVAPSRRDKPVTEIRKLEGLAPKFSGKEQEFAAWVALYLPVVHQARCPVAWKASVLAKSLDTTNDILKAIVEGTGASAQDYAKTINRLVREFGHPQGMLAARLKSLCSIREVSYGDFTAARKWLLRLEDYIDEAMRMEQKADVFGSQLYETNFGKMDREMKREYLQWIRIKNLEENAVTLCAWLEELVKDSRRLGDDNTAVNNRAFVSDGRQRAHSSPPFKGRKQEDFKQKKGRPPCPLDGQQHGLARCEMFLAMKPQERRQKLRELKRCYACFAAGHNIKACNKDVRCAECDKQHNTLLHNSNSMQAKHRANVADAGSRQWSDDSSSVGSPARQTIAMKTEGKGEQDKIALQTVPIDVYYKERKVQLNCLLDQGATGAFMSKRAARALKATGHLVRSSITGFDGAKTQGLVMVVSLQVSGTGEKRKHWVDVQVTQDPVASYTPVNWAEAKKGFAHLRNLPIKPPIKGKNVDIMIGMDTPQLVASLVPDIGGEDRRRPIARLTRLGWVVGGPTGEKETGDKQVKFAFNTRPWLPESWTGQSGLSALTFVAWEPEDARDPLCLGRSRDEELQSLVARMWEVDASYGKQKVSVQDQQIFQMLRRELKFKQGKYELPTIWKIGHPNIDNNYHFAKKRLTSLLRNKQFNQPEIMASYTQQIEEWLQEDYTEEVVTDQPEKDQAFYLPHFAVIRWDKASTKVRIVMDAAARTGRHQALNQCLQKGPKLINELVTVLLNFRRRPVALAADIKKMFLQIRMREEDRDFHRFVWQSENRTRIFRWKVHPFGSAASPCIAIFTIKEHARRVREKYPRAAETVINSTLVDDNLDSCDTVQEAVELGKQLIQLYGEAGMQLGKIISNERQVLEAFPEEMAAPSLDIAQFCQEESVTTVKALGLIYLPGDDVFSFTFEPPPETTSKRTILRHMAKLYDPHGLINPHIVEARLILREMWQRQIDWDQEVPEDIKKAWYKWNKVSEQLPQVRIPRCFQPHRKTQPDIHVFADASANAYAAAAYCVDEQTSYLMISKARVAPLKPMSIPRLELLGAELAAELGDAVRQAMGLGKEDMQYWTDSTNVLAWLRTEDRALQCFVANRTVKIREMTGSHRWRWVNTAQNPADIPSRGMLITTLRESELWWKGPGYLLKPKDTWPEQPSSVLPTHDGEKEFKRGAAFRATGHTDAAMDASGAKQGCWPELSSWTKLVGVVAWVQLFIRRCKGDRESTLDRQKSKQLLVKIMQREVWPNTYTDCAKGELKATDKLLPLRPFVDHCGLMRLGGRLAQREDLAFSKRHQMILPKDHPWTKLLVRETHERLFHQGHQHVLSKLREEYWIVQGSRMVRQVLTKCVLCRRQRPKAQQPPMGPLPEERLPTVRRTPVTHTALDAAGPFYTKDAEDVGVKKSYVILFTCLTYRAVHLEAVFSMTVNAFLQALDRFTARRGKPKAMRSDNGSNFVAGAGELRKLWKNRKEWQKKYPEIEWEFIPPKAPHMGGVHERLVGAMKRTLYHMFRPNTAPTSEQFVTMVTAVEGILNSRPITCVSTDHQDLEPITPSHFLGSAPYQQLAEPPGGAWDTRMQWRMVQDRLDKLWRRLVREMKGNLQIPKKWLKDGRNFREGDVVVVMEEKQRGVWPLGKIIRTEPSKDGIVRKVHVLTGGITVRRPANIMMLLVPAREGSGSHETQ